MIEVRDLYKEYQNKGEESKVIAVNHVSFEMKDGDFVAVMGPSGSGIWLMDLIARQVVKYCMMVRIFMK